MKCSMMFKRIITLWLAILLCESLCGTAFAVPEESDPAHPDGSGDILLVYDRRPDEIARLSIERLVTVGAAMLKVVDYGMVGDCCDVLGEYQYVIFYDIRSKDAAFLDAMRKSDASKMIIGGTLMQDYLSSTNRSELCLGEEAQKSGQLFYTFPSGQQYEAIVHWDFLGQYVSDGYENGTILTNGRSYPLCTEINGIRFIPLRDLSQMLVFTSLMQEIVRWMWPYHNRPTSYAQFLVLDNVYPFVPADQLMKQIEAIEETSVPYVISVMPLINNTNYPAMKQFCQVLSYAQTRGASIILHAPIIHKKVTNPEELYEKLTEMITPYFENGVFPLGIEVPLSWINQEPYLEVLKRFSTVFIYDDGKSSGFDMDANTSQFARQGHQVVYPLLELDQTGVSQLECYASATYMDYSTQSDLLLQYAQNSRKSNNPFMDLRDYNHTVWLDTCELSYQSRMAYIDGIYVSTDFQPAAYDTEFNFNRSPLVRMTLDLQNQNHVLMAIVLILSVVFLACIVYARIQMRKHFLSADKHIEE